MKQLTCEMCGSTDLIKQDGVFVCQTCGCKYSVEEAKKMMIEGTVEVTGTVSLDDSTVKQNKVRNFLDMANAALESGDYKGTLDYCDRALETDINSYEAWIIKAKIIGCGASPKDMKISQAIVAAKRAVELVPDAMKAEVADNLYRTIKEQINALLKIVHDSVGTIGGIDYTSDIHRLMMQWKDLLTDIPCLSSVLMKEEINEQEIKKFNYYGNIFSVHLVITLLSAVPLFFWLERLAFIPFGILFVITMYWALKVEKVKKDNDIQTYKEIVAFLEGKRLDEIQKQREIGKRPYQNVLKGIVAGIVTIVVCFLIGLLFHLLGN